MGTRDTTARRAALAGTLALGGALLLASAGPAAAATVQFAACPYTIPAPGTYVLAADLPCPAGFAAITVKANNVQLVLGKHTLASPQGGSFVGVFADGVTGLRVVGGTVTGFERGILIAAASGAGISGTTVSGNGGLGILLDSCASCQVTDSRASDDGGYGIVVHGDSPNTRVAGNTATGNGIGIRMDEETTGVRLTDNVATGNGVYDLEDDTPAPPCANTWRDNRFATTGGLGAGCIR
jgi:parallel beta-helix repeat protein